MRAVLILPLLVLSVAGCAADEDPYPVRPPGGGWGGGAGAGGGGGGGETPDGDLGSELTGRICVVLDWQDPTACPDVAARAGVEVADWWGTDTTTSDADGTFTLTTSAAVVTVRAATSIDDGLESTFSTFVRDGTPVDLPVVDSARWAATLDAVDDPAPDYPLVIYVVGPTGAPVAGAELSFPEASPLALPRVYPDDGGGGWLADDAGDATGPDGIALVLGVTITEVEATLGSRTTEAAILNHAFGVTIAWIVLPE